MNTAPAITTTTPLFTLAAEFAGYSLVEGLLGNMSAAEFLSDGTDEENAAAILAVAIDQVRDGSTFTTREAAEAYLEEMREEGTLYCLALEVAEFTCAGVVASIKASAE